MFVYMSLQRKFIIKHIKAFYETFFNMLVILWFVCILRMCLLRCAILANEIQSIIIMFHTYIQDILWKNFPDWCLPDKQHPILRFPPVEGRVCLYNCSCSSTSLPSTGGNLWIGCCLSGRHQSGKFFHRISSIYVWNIIMMLWISFARITLVWHILLSTH